MLKYDIKNLGLVMILSLGFVTIISYMISQYSDIPILRSGPAFILLLITMFLVYLYAIVKDAKIQRSEILTIVVMAISLIVSGLALKRYFPEIFSVFPEQTKQFFSAFVS